MNVKTFMLATALALAPVAASAQSWTGCGLGVGAGVAVADTNTNLALNGVGSLGIDGFSGSSAIASLGVACDIQVGRFVIGGFADYDYHNDTTTTLGLNSGGFNASADFGIDSAWTLGGRLGVLPTPTTLVYGLLGYSQAKTDGLNVTFGGNTTKFDIGDLSGWVVGAGVETALAQNWTLKGEYRYAMYDAATTAIIPGALDMNTDTDLHTVRAVLTYRFGMGGSEPAESVYRPPLK